MAMGESFPVQLAGFPAVSRASTCVHNCHVQSVFGQFIWMDSCEHAAKVNSPKHWYAQQVRGRFNTFWLPEKCKSQGNTHFTSIFSPPLHFLLFLAACLSPTHSLSLSLLSPIHYTVYVYFSPWKLSFSVPLDWKHCFFSPLVFWGWMAVVFFSFFFPFSLRQPIPSCYLGVAKLFGVWFAFQRLSVLAAAQS